MNIEKSIDKVERIIANPRYEQLRSFWEDFYEFKERNVIPIKVTFSMAFYAKELKLNLHNHYHDPKAYLKNSLKIIRHHHDNIHDDRVLGGVVINYGEVFESSLFGSQPIFWADQDPGLSPKPLITTENDLDRLDYPDFYRSGLMPTVIKVYETAEKILEGRIPVFFERWDRGPWGIAAHLRGTIELIKDVFRQPDFVHKLLHFITESRIRWEREKEKYLGSTIEKGSLYDDDISADFISPKIYQTFVYPCETELAKFYPQGIFYFHSCGNITPFLETIGTLCGLRRIQISPATNFEGALNTLDNNFVYQKRLHPINDVLRCDDKTMEQKISTILKMAKGKTIELDPGPFLNISLDKLNNWIKIARACITRAS